MTGSPSSLNSHSVLIVDQSEETKEVLRAVLQPRGVRVLETVEAHQGLEMARLHQPRVIVLDLEAEAADDEMVRDQFDESSASLVILGKARRYEQTLPKERVMAKPYHYAPLIRTIEQLLERSTISKAAG